MEMRTPPHLFQRGGVWYVKKVIRGEERRASTGVKVAGQIEMKKAWGLAQQILTQWEKDASGAKEIPTFKEWWETYKETYSVQKAKPEMDETMVSHALARWGRIKLTHITKSMCEKLLNDRLKQVEQGTVTRMRGLIQAIFQRAIEDDLLEKNPFKAIDRIPDKVRMRVLTHEEQTKLHAVLSPQFQRWLVMMIGTGLRIEEACAVLPEALDRKARLLHVSEEAAKYHKARAVPLYDLVEEAIDDQWEAMGRLWNANQQNYRDILQVGAEKADIEHLSPHALRHTFATRYLAAGGNIFILSKILGHASVTLTEKQYVHLVKADLVERSKGLDLGLTPRASNVVEFKTAQNRDQ